MDHLEIVMKKAVGLTLFVCVSTWCTSGWCEEKKLDPGVVNDWMRATVSSDSDDTELKRVVHSSTIVNWTRHDTFYHVRYEVMNSSCKRTLTFNFTDFHGNSFYPDWVKSIEGDRETDSVQIEDPKVLIRSYRKKQPNDARPIMDVDVEYQVQDGMPVLVVSNQRDVIRTLREFQAGYEARVRISAFGTSTSFDLDLQGFAEKLDWSNEHCPLEDTPSRNTKETPAS